MEPPDKSEQEQLRLLLSNHFELQQILENPPAAKTSDPNGPGSGPGTNGIGAIAAAIEPLPPADPTAAVTESMSAFLREIDGWLVEGSEAPATEQSPMAQTVAEGRALISNPPPALATDLGSLEEYGIASDAVSSTPIQHAAPTTLAASTRAETRPWLSGVGSHWEWRLGAAAVVILIAVSGVRMYRNRANAQRPPGPPPISSRRDASAEPARAVAPVLPVVVSRIQTSSSRHVTTIEVTVDAPVRFESNRLRKPHRIYFDLSNAKLVADLAGKRFDVSRTIAHRLRIDQRGPNVVRMTVETAQFCDYSAEVLSNPYRLVVRIRRPQPTKIARVAPRL